MVVDRCGDETFAEHGGDTAGARGDGTSAGKLHELAAQLLTLSWRRAGTDIEHEFVFAAAKGERDFTAAANEAMISSSSTKTARCKVGA